MAVEPVAKVLEQRHRLILEDPPPLIGRAGAQLGLDREDLADELQRLVCQWRCPWLFGHIEVAAPHVCPAQAMGHAAGAKRGEMAVVV